MDIDNRMGEDLKYPFIYIYIRYSVNYRLMVILMTVAYCLNVNAIHTSQSAFEVELFTHALPLNLLAFVRVLM